MADTKMNLVPKELLSDSELMNNLIKMSKMMSELGLYNNHQTIDECCIVIKKYIQASVQFKQKTNATTHLPIDVIQIEIDGTRINLMDAYNRIQIGLLFQTQAQ